MGRKGTNKSKPVSKNKQNGSVIELMRDKGAPLNKAGANPLAESNKAHKKGK
jgi:hypothetical protein